MDNGKNEEIAKLEFVAPPGSALGGPEQWVLSGHGNSEMFTSAHALWIRVGWLIKEGHRTLRIERQGSPNPKTP